jgi:hypothetical protein
VTPMDFIYALAAILAVVAFCWCIVAVVGGSELAIAWVRKQLIPGAEQHETCKPARNSKRKSAQ